MGSSSGGSFSISGGNAAASIASSLGINTASLSSVSVGYNSAPLNQGYSNVIVGYMAAQYSQTAAGSTIIGFAAAPYAASTNVVYVGRQAAQQAQSATANVAVGAMVAPTLVSGDSNVLIGTMADVHSDGFGGTAVGHRARAETYGTALGAGAAALGRGSVALGGGAVSSNDGEFNLAGRVRGYIALSNVSGEPPRMVTYAVQVDADALKIGGGGALAFCADRGSNAAPMWAACLSGADLELRSSNGAVVRFVDDFRAGLLDFTAQHRCVLRPREEDGPLGLAGRIVVATGEYDSSVGGAGHVSADEAVPVVEMSSRAGDPRAFGVLSSAPPGWRIGNIEFSRAEREDEGSEDMRVLVNAAGEGGIWVCDEGGALRNGDLVTTGSTLHGVGMRQTEAWVAAHTAAKVTCDCDFERVAPGPVVAVQVGDRNVRACLVGCTYRF